MDHGRKSANSFLFPPIEPFDRQMIDVGDGHRVYVERCGNPKGLPVVVFHGGPGGGCSPAMRRYFDPARYHIILFDQRGCGRSRPHASVDHNTTWHLVADAELIRHSLGIERWCLFGGSWGATLSLIYAITHPERVIHMALRGIFLMTQAELDWFYGGGAGAFWPELWRDFAGMVPSEEQGDLVSAYASRLFSGDRSEEVRFARAWAAWENTLASMANTGRGGDSPGEYARAFARIENHYFSNSGFLETDGWIVENAHRIADIPGAIVHGRYDMICPPKAAWALKEAWPAARLMIVPRAGHALSEPGITAELVQVNNDAVSRFG